jgi:hypothetical protein
LSKKLIGFGAGGTVIVLIVIITLSIDTSDSPRPILSNDPTKLVPQDKQHLPDTNSSQSIMQEEATQTYRINTQCELLYAMQMAVYPNDKELPPVNLEILEQEYPQRFNQWNEILADNQKFQEFIQNGASPEFVDAYVLSIMDYVSINPQLKSTTTLMFDSHGLEHLQELFFVHNCKEYFDSRNH